MRFLLLLVLPALAGTHAPPTTTVAEGTPIPPQLPTAYTAGEVLCVDRKGCKVEDVVTAGYDAGKRALAVARVSLPPKSGSGESMGCDRYEWWLVTWQETRVRPMQLLLAACNDGYGASGVGEDALTVKENAIEWTRYGGSSWRWTQSATAHLSPPRVITESLTGFWASDPFHTEATLWDWDTLSGITRWYAPPCGKGGQPDTTGLPDDGVPENVEYRFVDLPQLELPGLYTTGTWKRTSIGSCGALVDSSGGQGFVIFGSPGEPQDAAMRVVMEGRSDLYVEVVDDTLVPTARVPLFADHLELWTGEKASYAEFCVESRPTPAQWLIDLQGKVMASYGDPTTHPTAQVTIEGNTARFHITLPDEVSALTVVWSDSDDGEQQERLVATSRLKRGDRGSLGRPTRFEPEVAACEIKGAKLEMVMKRTLQPDVALIGGE